MSIILLSLIFLVSDVSKTKLIQGNEGAFLESLFEKLDNSKEGNLFFDQKRVVLPESPDLSVIQQNSLVGVSCPQILSSKALGAIVGESFDETHNEIIEYIVKEGDNLWSIANEFGISLDTLRGANSLSGDTITIGKKLVILPIDGVIHHIKSGDTVSEIANTYKGKTDEILAFNELSDEGDIYIGDILLIPGGVIPKTPSLVVQVPIGSSYFIFPTQGKITQRLHWYNAVDVANDCGTPIYAAASGTVLKVKMTSSCSRWAFGGMGSHLTILHPNGVVTYYGHISVRFVSPGDEVYQGQKIALIGGQPGTPGAGRSTGCHLHFGVSHAKNPLRNYSTGSYIEY